MRSTDDNPAAPVRVERLTVPVILAGCGAIVLWSGTAIANKVAVAHMDPMTAGVFRSMLAGILALGIASAARLRGPRTAAEWRLLFASGLASFALWPMALSLGLGRTTANHAGLIFALLPFFTGLLGAALEGKRLGRGWWGGMTLAVAGTALLVFYRSGGALLTEAGGLGGDLVILGGCVVCALGYVAGGRLSRAIGTWGTTLWGLSAALVLLVPVFLLRMGRTDWGAIGGAGWGAIAYMTLLSSLAGYAAWFWALGRGGIARIGSWQLALPVLTLGWAALLLGEAVTLPLVLSAAAILTGTAVAQRSAA